MNRQAYCDRVLSCLHRVTRQERQAIRAELDGHMEDHICALLDLGYPEELAEERTMALMGDPEETGRALDRQYPFYWLAVKWAAMAAVLVLALLMLRGMDWQMVRLNLESRFLPSRLFSYEEPYEFLRGDDTDIRMEVGPAVARVCAARVVQVQPGMALLEGWPAGSYAAVLYIRHYGSALWDLGRCVSVPCLDFSFEGTDAFQSFTGNCAAFYFVGVEPGQAAVTMGCRKYGHDVTCEIPLDWGDVT